MGEIINLNQYRKKRDRLEKAKRAARNRARHGIAKDERARTRREAEQGQGELDGKRLDPDSSDEPPKVS